MDPILGGLISGGASLLGSIFGTTQNNANAQQMQAQQEQYQTQMSNTAYQRATADMKAAGLNPMMMFGSGSAASSPTVQPAVKSSPVAGVGPAVQQAISTATALKTADATINNLVEQNAKIKAEVETERVRPSLVAAETGAASARGQLTAQEEANARAKLPVILDEALSSRNRSDMNPTVRKLLDQFGFGGRKVDETMSPVSNILSSALGVGKYIRGY